MERRVTTQDITWFLDLETNNQLDLNPTYQRRSVWSPKDRRFFLDTIFRGYPSPPIFLHRVRQADGRGTYEVVDGKQRLETILGFANNRIALAKDFGDSDYDGKKWRDLSTDQKRLLWDYVISVEFIMITEGTLINEVFDRLNRNARKLERQELRHARYDGWLISLAEQESEQRIWRDLKVVTTARARRMSDVQFLSELLGVLLKKRLSGFDQDALDDLCAEYEVPEETQSGWEAAEVLERLDELKSYVLKMEERSACVTTHAKTYVHFYSMWVLLALEFENLPPAEELADTYWAFMNEVDTLKKQTDLEEFLRTQKGDRFSVPHQYLVGASGASTDEPQRQRRHHALGVALLGLDGK